MVVAELYEDIRAGIVDFHRTQFSAPRGVELNADDWDEFLAATDSRGDRLFTSQLMHGLPVTIAADLRRGEFRVT